MTLQSWAKVVSIDQLDPNTAYFIAIKRGHGMHCESYEFYATDIKGRQIISEKPGIAVRALGTEKLAKILRENADHVALAIPSDADTRWTRRKRRMK